MPRLVFFVSTSATDYTMPDYGAASNYQFDDPAKWVTVSSVPLLDEHEMTNSDGKPITYVDRHALQQIANNNNKRVMETGDPATLILGHTSDDPRAPEKAARGFVVNYRVKPFKRNPDGSVTYAIHGDYKIRPKNAHLLEQYPRRSVELWWNKREIDPIAMLGGSAPERDLGVVIRNGRINHVDLSAPAKRMVNGRAVPVTTNAADSPIKFHRRGNWVIETYPILDPVPSRNSRRSGTVPPQNRPRKYGMGNTRCSPDESYGAGDMNDDGMGTGDYDGGDDAPLDSQDDMNDDEMNDGGGDDDPMVAKVFQSKQWKDLSSKLDMILEALGDQSGGGAPGMDGAPSEEMPPPGQGAPPGMGAAPGGAGGMDGSQYPDDNPEEDEARMHGAPPVQMDAYTTGMPGPGSTNIPGMGGTKGKRNMPYSRNGQRGQRSQQPNEVVRLQRQMADMRLKLARADAEKLISGLEQEGIRFGRSPELHEKGKAEEALYLAHLLTQPDGDKEVDYQINSVIRARYERKRPDPAAPSAVGLARYSRPTEGPAPTEDDYEPQTPQEANMLVELTNPHGKMKLSRAEAIKRMRDAANR